MKKTFLVIAIALIASLTLMGCKADTTAAEDNTYKIALVTDVGNIDDKSFNEGAWNGVVQYATENNVSYAYYRPTEDSTQARLDAIDTAVENGAVVVVCPGYMFADAVSTAQATYPNVAFLILDAEPATAADNTHAIYYQEEQAGFLAGYAAVVDGYRSLGFVGGMAVPAVVRFGYGFVQGAEYAANELNLAAGAVTIDYYYANAFWGSDELETKVLGWYNNGIEVVFACGGSLYTSVVSAAAFNDDDVIGVDVDQHNESTTIITSAMKGLTASVYSSLVAFFDNDQAWPAGYASTTSTLGAAQNGVGLPTSDEAWGFSSFTVAQYNTIFGKLVDGTVVVSSAIDAAPTVSKVTVTYE